MHIGDSVQEAIDWTQDRLRTTRPLAERTLFALIADKRVTETEDGFLLAEQAEEELQKTHHGLKFKAMHRPRFRFHHARRHFKHLRQHMQQLKRLDSSDADDMLTAQEDPDAVS